MVQTWLKYIWRFDIIFLTVNKYMLDFLFGLDTDISSIICLAKKRLCSTWIIWLQAVKI